MWLNIGIKYQHTQIEGVKKKKKRTRLIYPRFEYNEYLYTYCPPATPPPIHPQRKRKKEKERGKKGKKKKNKEKKTPQKKKEKQSCLYAINLLLPPRIEIFYIDTLL
uniref:Uncharacterized protein n=1 Tax=Nelumbo nucifera TaxID=4432 RepID=A0A822XI64_NELNU|nr:TPA_asm: hypothetical protein HUJ06_021125 [Nelumbo nucifera]